MAPALLVLTDTERFPSPERVLEPLCTALPPGSVGVIVRDRGLAELEWLRLAEALAEMTARAHQRLILAERVEHVRRFSAFGVHLGAGGLLPSAVRAVAPELAWISRALHGYEALPAAEKEALDAVLVSPVFAARKGRPPLGLRRFRELARELAPRPVYALGGVSSAEMADCIASGARGVAMIEAAHLEPPERFLAPILESKRVGFRS